MRILIIRHGDPDYEHDSLTEKGHKEAAYLAERLKNEKIDYIYSSPLGRAYETCMYTAKAMGREKEVKVLPWLREFNYPVEGQLKEKGCDILWDMLPQFWMHKEEMYDKNAWQKQELFEVAELELHYNGVKKGFDELLAKHGYVREEGARYKVENSNRDTIALFCHFGLEMILFSILMNVSPVPLLHHFVAAPTSVTTIYSEERRKGIASFRCSSFGDTGHLYVKGEPPAFAARYCETFDSDEIHDFI